LMFVLFLTGMVAMILRRVLYTDFHRYNQMDPAIEFEEIEWKLVHGDVFRPPAHPMLFSVLLGSGVQVLSMTLVTMGKS
jgi:transmembrane 9 superfamily protein 2/4